MTERKKRIKPFFDNKIQTDLNCYWLYSNLYSSLILEDNELLDQTNKKIEFLKNKLSKKIFHCYDKNDDEIDDKYDKMMTKVMTRMIKLGWHLKTMLAATQPYFDDNMTN